MWEATGRKNLPMLEDESWDGDVARREIFAWAGYPDDFNPSQAAGGFLLHDTENPENLGAFKDPFARVVDGELRASQAGLRAAASRLPQTDVPQKALDRARSIIDHYQTRMHDMPHDSDEDHSKEAYAYVWVGSPVNAWEDNDPVKEHRIIPLKLIEADIERQKSAIAGGRAKDFGPLQVRHHDELEIGRVLVREIVPGTRSTIEAGIISDPAVGEMLHGETERGKTFPMSHRYNFLMDAKTHEYIGVKKFESTVTTARHAANPRTMFKVYRVPGAKLDKILKTVVS